MCIIYLFCIIIIANNNLSLSTKSQKMLMFDNAIFASLIPQFLMVLGFFSVIIAPSLTSNNKPDTEKEIKIEIVTVSLVNQNLSTSYRFQDYVDQTQDVISEENIQYLKISIIKEVYIPLFDIQLLENERNFSLFSRPPPIL